MSKKITTSDFIRRAREKHGDKYDYGQSEYIGADEKITIICPEHGPWTPTASSHLAGSGCPDCGGRKQLTTDQFIERAWKMHGDKYDYSKTFYSNTETSLTVICPDHGEFEQRPHTHLKGWGCPECAKLQRGLSKRGTTENFISRARVVHGDKYDYSETKYSRTHDKVKIICPEHGVFEQTPANHLQGSGCRLCGLKNAGQYHKKDAEKFIVAARKVHGDRYDYSKTDYVGAREPLTIICRKHGPFEQTAGVHLRGAGCEPCSYEGRAQRQRITFEEFETRAKEIHAGFYDYSIAGDKFLSGSDKVPIVCPEHGVFEQLPIGHLQGSGCPDCSYIKTAEELRKTTADFIKDTKAAHGNKYDYSQTNYVGAHEHVVIICPIDGAFTQSPTSHLGGTGCPRCSRRGQGAPRNLVRALRGEFDDPREAFVYVIHFQLPSSSKHLFKIGSGSGSRWRTAAASIRRIGGTVYEIERRDFKNSGDAIVFEHIAHDQVMEAKFIIPPEFKFPGYSEVFACKPDLSAVDSHPTLFRFRSGDRWDPREEIERDSGI